MVQAVVLDLKKRYAANSSRAPRNDVMNLCRFFWPIPSDGAPQKVRDQRASDPPEPS
jgi:hypothetical protein